MERITANTIEKLVKSINSLEYHLNPQDSKRYHGGMVWSVDIFHGVYIRREHENPTCSSGRLSMREAYHFLSAIYFILHKEYLKTRS